MPENPTAENPKWRRKTEAERWRGDRLLQESRLSFRTPLALALMIGAGPAMGALIANDRLLSLAFALFATLLGIAVFFISYGIRAFAWRPNSTTPILGICTKCFKFSIDGSKDYCECGGLLEDADGWTLNKCPFCGYDLRASGSKCPECGAEITPAALSSAQIDSKHL